MDTDKHGILSDAAFEADAQEFLRFDGEFHREFAEDFLAEAVDDHVDGVLRGDAALVAVKNLVLADLGGGGFVLDCDRWCFCTSM